MYVYMHICVYIHVYVCMCVCVYIYTYRISTLFKGHEQHCYCVLCDVKPQCDYRQALVWLISFSKLITSWAEVPICPQRGSLGGTVSPQLGQIIQLQPDTWVSYGEILWEPGNTLALEPYLSLFIWNLNIRPSMTSPLSSDCAEPWISFLAFTKS